MELTFLLVWSLILAGMWYFAFWSLIGGTLVGVLKDPDRTFRVGLFIIKLVEFVVGLIGWVIFLIFCVYFFSETSRPSIERGVEHTLCFAERHTYTIFNDEIDGPFYNPYFNAPVCESNYDLTILDEVCRTSTPYSIPNDPARIAEWCPHALSSKAFSTYFARMPTGEYRYSVMQARALYLGKPLPADPAWEAQWR